MANNLGLRANFLRGCAGDHKAHHAFLSAVTPLLRGYFRKRLSDCADAEDLVQDVLVILHTRRHTYDPTYPLTAWMYAIAKHRLCDFLRRRNRRSERSLEGLEFAAPDPSFAASDARRDLGELMSRLCPKQQAVIRLVKLEQRHVREVATATKLTESDIKVSVHRGLRAMQTWAKEAALTP